MTRKIKTLGVALVAVFALTAVMASAASAASFTASSYPTTGTGVSAIGNDVLMTEAGTVECAVHFEGTLVGESSDLTVTPTYTNCKAFGFVSATMTGCKYTFTAVSTTSANVDVVNPCTILVSNCHVTVPNQGSLSHTEIEINFGFFRFKKTWGKITYNVVKDGFLCPFNGTGEKTGATYNQGEAITFASTNGAALSVS